MLKRVIAAVLLCTTQFGLHAETIENSTRFALLGEPKYAENFSHFDYVNPDAAKGGSITLSALGTFDNFNRFALRGAAAARTERLYDSLFTSSDD
ncbi:ABC transporter substrate-binding protein, partial [Dickeya dadantii]|nr:ABC transporter substrate-binding protein [Dickeya dadantii]